MDRDQLIAIVPHYVAMLVLVYIVLFLIEAMVGDLTFWIEVVLIIVVVFAYRPLVLWLGVGPSSWERE
jgi:hypothetical protein